MAELDQLLEEKFVCQHCEHQGAHVERLAMSGTGISRLLEIQQYRYAFVSCRHCGFTEVFNLRILQQHNGLSDFLDMVFLN